MSLEIDNVKTELKSIFWKEDEIITLGTFSSPSTRGVIRIVLANDGYGTAGMYDRIHVIQENGKHFIYPAHNVEGFEVLTS